MRLKLVWEAYICLTILIICSLIFFVNDLRFGKDPQSTVEWVRQVIQKATYVSVGPLGLKC